MLPPAKRGAISLSIRKENYRAGSYKMASFSNEVYNVHISNLPIDINGGFAFFGDPCALSELSVFGVQCRVKVLKGAFLKKLHHSGLPEPEIRV
ncbi:unnamed protein product [Pieris brassicae]|uniref:Uncharacterized protein n=1 Tax=Pieris brassicae TaxID=7116 RepID=A0A9P0X373_PIEBR|nr:unnamed protein product [Pieris brassicae]